MIDHNDLEHLQTSIDVARQALAHGNEPFGAVLYDAAGNELLRAENTQVSDRDCTAHAETNLVRMASRALDAQALRRTTLYASCEPCPMCAGAIAAAGIGRVVFALGQASARRSMGLPPNPQGLSCAELLARHLPSVPADGPAIEDDAAGPLREYFKR